MADGKSDMYKTNLNNFVHMEKHNKANCEHDYFPNMHFTG